MWGVPVDHKMFSEINTAQWLWYYHNYLEDKDEQFITQRDFVEYHASFIEPESVRKIREAREESVEVPHEEFIGGIEYFFGRKIGITKERRKGSETRSIDPKTAIMNSDNYKRVQTTERKEQSQRVLDYKFWTNLDLE